MERQSLRFAQRLDRCVKFSNGRNLSMSRRRTCSRLNGGLRKKSGRLRSSAYCNGMVNKNLGMIVVSQQASVKHDHLTNHLNRCYLDVIAEIWQKPPLESELIISRTPIALHWTPV